MTDRFELSFEEVYAQNVRFVWRVLRGMGLRDGTVDDAVQDVFMVVHRRLPEFDGKHALRTWLFAIAYRVACDHRRKHRRSSANDVFDDEAPPLATLEGDDPAGKAERAERLHTLLTALDSLDDDKRALIVLAEIEGQTAVEIAAATATSLNTVYTRLRRARLELQAILRGTHEKRGSR